MRCFRCKMHCRQNSFLPLEETHKMVELSGKWQRARDKNANGFRAAGAPEGHRHWVKWPSRNISGHALFNKLLPSIAPNRSQGQQKGKAWARCKIKPEEEDPSYWLLMDLSWVVKRVQRRGRGLRGIPLHRIWALPRENKHLKTLNWHLCWHIK